MPTEADALRQEIRDLCERRARGDVQDRQFQRLLADKSVALSRTVAKARLDQNETVVAEHHVVYSHFKLAQSVLQEPEQVTASFFASDRRLVRVLGTLVPGRPVSYDDADHSTVEDVTYKHIERIVPKSQYRWGEIGTGFLVILVALLLRDVLAVTGPALVLLGGGGVLHGVFFPTRWAEIVRSGASQPSSFEMHSVGKRSAKAVLAAIRDGMSREAVVRIGVDHGG